MYQRSVDNNNYLWLFDNLPNEGSCKNLLVIINDVSEVSYLQMKIDLFIGATRF